MAIRVLRRRRRSPPEKPASFPLSLLPTPEQAVPTAVAASSATPRGNRRRTSCRRRGIFFAAARSRDFQPAGRPSNLCCRRDARTGTTSITDGEAALRVLKKIIVSLLPFRRVFFSKLPDTNYGAFSVERKMSWPPLTALGPRTHISQENIFQARYARLMLLLFHDHELPPFRNRPTQIVTI